MGWTGIDILIALVTVLGLPISLLIGGVFIAAALVTLTILGILSAVIWCIVGTGIVWLISMVNRNFVKNHLKILLIIPAFFAIGYASEHIKGLEIIAPGRLISENAIGIQQMSITGNATAFVMNNLLFATLLIMLAAVTGTIGYLKLKHRK